MDAGELRLTDIPRRHGGFLAVSQSGETRDLIKALKHAELAGVARMSVVNTVGSAIARETVRRMYDTVAMLWFFFSFCEAFFFFLLSLFLSTMLYPVFVQILRCKINTSYEV